MKAYFFDLINKLQRTSITLDIKAILCNKTWRVFSDTNEKELYIFMEDGKLIISHNGNVEMGNWIYIPANRSLVISANQSYLVHPFICNNVLALIVDGSNQCAFLMDDTKRELEALKSLNHITSYISSNMNYLPSPGLNRNPNTFIFGKNGKRIDGALFLDMRQVIRKYGYGKRGIYLPNDHIDYQGYYIWACSTDCEKPFDDCAFTFIFDEDGTISTFHYKSVMPNGKWRCWLRTNRYVRKNRFSKKITYKFETDYNIPGQGNCVNEMIDKKSWMSMFGEYLKTDVKKYYNLLYDLFGVDPIDDPFWEWTTYTE